MMLEKWVGNFYTVNVDISFETFNDLLQGENQESKQKSMFLLSQRTKRLQSMRNERTGRKKSYRRCYLTSRYMIHL